jgi:hypothetical protein
MDIERSRLLDLEPHLTAHEHREWPSQIHDRLEVELEDGNVVFNRYEHYANAHRSRRQRRDGAGVRAG